MNFFVYNKSICSYNLIVPDYPARETTVMVADLGFGDDKLPRPCSGLSSKCQEYKPRELCSLGFFLSQEFFKA